LTAALVNGASRLAMDAERIAKVQAAIGRGVLVSRSRRALSESIADFDRGARTFASATLPPEVRDNFRLLRHLWDEYRSAAQQPPTREGARKLNERCEEVAWIAQKGARLLHQHAPSPASELVLAAGEARAAAQRIAKIELLRGWALAEMAGEREIKASQAQIFLALARLKSAAPIAEPAVRALEMAESQFALMRQAAVGLRSGRDAATHLEHIAKAADHIAASFDAIADAAEKALA
jgi:hypothetical protein